MQTALILQVLTALPTVTVGITHLISWLNSVRTVAKQSGEWTTDMETKFVNSLIQRATDPAYQPDKQ